MLKLKCKNGLTTSPVSIVHDRSKVKYTSTSVNNPLVKQR